MTAVLARLRAPAHHRFARAVCRAVFPVIARVRVAGLEHVPVDRSFVFCANHLSYFDAPLAFAYLPPVRLYVLAARKYRTHLFFGPLLTLMNVIWITQRGADRMALDAAGSALAGGYPLAMAPEGTRSTTKALIQARPGVAYLATQFNIPIVPCALTGTERLWSNLVHLQRSNLSVTFGPPFRLAPVEGQNRTAQLNERTDVIMAHIACMLPEAYRGVYAAHPYLEALESGRGPLPGELPL